MLMIRRFCSTVLPKSVRVLPMPRLSPSMTKGTIEKWHIRAGEAVSSYQVVLEVSTKDLTETPNETHTLDIEIHEDMFVAKVMGEEGKTYRTGEPIALFCDEEAQVGETQRIELTSSLDSYEMANGTQMVLWQAFVQSNGDSTPRCSCG